MPQAPGYSALPTVDSTGSENPAGESKDQPRVVSQIFLLIAVYKQVYLYFELWIGTQVSWQQQQQQVVRVQQHK